MDHQFLGVTNKYLQLGKLLYLSEVSWVRLSGDLASPILMRSSEEGPLLRYANLNEGFVCMQFFASSLGVLTASEFLSGFIRGNTPSLLLHMHLRYVLPVNVRGYLTAYISL